MASLTVKLVTGTSDDLEANLQAFRSAYVKYVAEHAEMDEAIAEAVNAVFDQYRGAAINMPALATFSLQRLNVQPENFAIMEERVLNWVRENADQPEVKDKETGTVLKKAEPDRTRTFSIKKGKGVGGVRRWSDIPIAPAK